MNQIAEKPLNTYKTGIANAAIPNARHTERQTWADYELNPLDAK